ncbi:MAG: LuxR family transcriptional regulator [Propionibacteriaceae bacterium]
MDSAAPWNVEVLADELAERAREDTAGRAAKHLSGGPDSTMTHTVIALTEGSELSEHENPGEASVLVLAGHVRLDDPEGSAEGRQGDLLVVPPRRHGLTALADSVVLLTAVKLHAH